MRERERERKGVRDVSNSAFQSSRDCKSSTPLEIQSDLCTLTWPADYSTFPLAPYIKFAINTREREKEEEKTRERSRREYK